MALGLYLQHASEPALAQMLWQPRQLLEAVMPVRTPVPGSHVLGLRRSWHVLHGLFTGSAWEGPSPANTLMAGGREFGPDLGCGQPRLVCAAGTQAFARFVAPLCPHQLKGRIDPRRVARTRFYAAEDAACPDVEDLREIVMRDLPMLKAYLGRAADRGDGMLVWMM
jgi:hypothetical protein